MAQPIYYAHSLGKEKAAWQTLTSHLKGTADLVLQLGQGTGVEPYAYVAALFHDLGKYSLLFQKRLQGSPLPVDHSTAGAKEIEYLYGANPQQRVIAEMLAYCIAGHHSGLMDFGSSIDLPTEGTLRGRLKKELPDYSAYAGEAALPDPPFPTRLPLVPTSSTGKFSLSFFTRMIYSLLVDADFQDTETFFNGGKRPRGEFATIDTLLQRLELFLTKFPEPVTPVNQQRAQTLHECIAAAKQAPGLFTLTVPTGGGKTLSSLAFALTHAQRNHLSRVIYVIPYTTIIEQNASVFKACLGEENVLEHHSNFDWEAASKAVGADVVDDQTNLVTEKLKLSAENWDVPVVVTTNVQFFESLFANRSSRSRKVHNMARSVLIFDEAQMLPREYLEPCMRAVNELVTNYGASAIFCTATQPVLARFFPPASSFHEISHHPAQLYERYKRVQVTFDGKLTDVEVAQRLNEQEQGLCIVNTRRHAQALFKELILEESFHLSTWMCPQHRHQVITEIRRRLQQGAPCRVVSTQLMEAGVDLDFPLGYRALAGIDSIIQAAGRVNREGRLSSGMLHVFEPETASIRKLPQELAQSAQVARSILDKYPADPICLEAIKDYYTLLYDVQGKQAFDSHHILDCFEKEHSEPTDFSFATAAQNFKLIEENTVALVIPFADQVQELLEDRRLLAKPYLLLRKLQPYTINVFENELNNLQRKGAIHFVNEEIPVLQEMQFYSLKTGLILPEEINGEAIMM
ncbi:MAG: CRISPR-associated helicase Cas3' [Anaerolineaceae bacterium]|nr:CRISPR-associated helicase Cas3' [Anaerolineaceae bacterium]